MDFDPNGHFLSASVGYVTLHSLLSMVGENCEWFYILLFHSNRRLFKTGIIRNVIKILTENHGGGFFLQITLT